MPPVLKNSATTPTAYEHAPSQRAPMTSLFPFPAFFFPELEASSPQLDLPLNTGSSRRTSMLDLKTGSERLGRSWLTNPVGLAKLPVAGIGLPCIPSIGFLLELCLSRGVDFASL